MRTRSPLKKTFASLLLLVYVCGVVRPLVPVVNDILAHCFWKMEHLATVHCENGKYHVHVEIAKEEGKSSKSAGETAAFETMAVHLNNENITFPIYTARTQNSVPPALLSFYSNDLQSESPPPRNIG